MRGILTVFRKEFFENLRDRRTILTALLSFKHGDAAPTRPGAGTPARRRAALSAAGVQWRPTSTRRH